MSRRIYELSREVIEFQRACHPLGRHAAGPERGFDKYHVDVELQRLLRDVHDHAMRVVERADSFRALLQNALTVNAALVGQRQNEEMRTPHRGQPGAERGGQEDLGVGRDPVRPHPGRHRSTA